jgi:hypothetical protein
VSDEENWMLWVEFGVENRERIVDVEKLGMFSVMTVESEKFHVEDDRTEGAKKIREN